MKYFVTKRRASVRRQLDGESEGHNLFDKPPVMADYANNQGAEQAAGKMTAEQMMTFMDSNGDGRITRDEAPAELKAGFDFFDQNKDGGIDINEAQILVDYDDNQAAGKMTAEQMMTFMDSNSDGRITRDEGRL